MNDANHKFSRVFAFARAEHNQFFPAVLRNLKSRYDCEIHLFCNGPQEVRYYKKMNTDGLFASVTDGKVLLQEDSEAALDKDAVYARARKMEEKIGFTYNFLNVSNRHLGRAYSLGGFYHPRSRFSESVGYTSMVHSYNEAFAFWEEQFAQKKPTMMINADRLAAVYGRATGVPMRFLAHSRFQEYFYWAWNEYFESPAFEATLDDIDDSDGVDFDKPYNLHLVNRKARLREMTLPVASYRAARFVAQFAWWHYKGYAKAKEYFMTDTVLFPLRAWWQWRKVKKLAKANLSDLAGQRFVFYPMHIEPERALQGFSPEYFYQIALIAAVSRDLPAGYKLAVKEILTACGRRPANFYDQIAQFKNVVLLDPLEHGLSCARQAAATVTICGTAGLEAAVAGNPVIAFGKHNIYNCLPHVWNLETESDLPEALNWVLSETRIEEKDRNAGIGRRFLGAIKAQSFDMVGYHHKNKAGFSTEQVEGATDSLARSVEQTALMLNGAPGQKTVYTADAA